MRYSPNMNIHMLTSTHENFISHSKLKWSVLFLQDATQGNIRFNRAGNQHSMSYASNGKSIWIRAICRAHVKRPKMLLTSTLQHAYLSRTIELRPFAYRISKLSCILCVFSALVNGSGGPFDYISFIEQYWPCLFISLSFRLHKSNISILSVANCFNLGQLRPPFFIQTHIYTVHRSCPPPVRHSTQMRHNEKNIASSDFVNKS